MIPPRGSLQVRQDPKCSVSLDEWLSKALARLVDGRGPADSLLVNERGEAMTPRRLQQRVAERLKGKAPNIGGPSNAGRFLM